MRGSRASQVGFLMRAYRESFNREDGLRGLTQEELLQRMASVDPDYAERYSHTTVSRWESGRTRPNLQRLEVFGKALDLSEDEMSGLIALAGVIPQALKDPGQDAADNAAVAEPGPQAFPPVVSPEEFADFMGTGRVPSTARSLFRFVLLRCLPSALFILALGYGLFLIGWDGSWMPVGYVGLVTCLIMVLGLLLPDRQAGIRDLLWVSLFFLLTSPALQFAPLGLDHYNIHTVSIPRVDFPWAGVYVAGPLAGTPAPHGLVLLVNLLLASVGAVMFQVVLRFTRHRVGNSLLRGAVWAVLPPFVLVYGVVVIITNVSVAIQLSVVLPVTAFVMTLLVILRDPSVYLSGRERRFMLSSIMAIALVAALLGIGTALGIYLAPDVPRVLPDHNLLRSWELDFAALGYSREEALDRLNLGYMWHAMCTFVYVTFIVGGILVADIYRTGDDGRPEPVAASGAVVVSAREEEDL